MILPSTQNDRPATAPSAQDLRPPDALNSAHRQAKWLVAVGLATLGLSVWLPTPQVAPKLQLFVYLGLQTLVLLGIPLLFAKTVLALPPADLGLRLARPKVWLREVALLGLVALPLLIALSRLPAIRAYYPVYAYARREPWLLVPATVAFAGYGLAWEFLFRGVLQLGTRPALSGASVVVQLLPFVLAHAGKPVVEVALSVVSGLVLGGLAHRHSTILPAWTLHLGCSTLLNVLCLLP